MNGLEEVIHYNNRLKSAPFISHNKGIVLSREYIDQSKRVSYTYQRM